MEERHYVEVKNMGNHARIELELWCMGEYKSFIGSVHYFGNCEFTFSDQADAVEFKLKWG